MGRVVETMATVGRGGREKNKVQFSFLNKNIHTIFSHPNSSCSATRVLVAREQKCGGHELIN